MDKECDNFYCGLECKYHKQMYYATDGFVDYYQWKIHPIHDWFNKLISKLLRKK